MTRSEPNGTQTAGSPPSKLKRLWPLIALVIVVATLIVGELAFQRAKHRGWTTYTTAHGLASDNITSVGFAPDGTPWVATIHGDVSRSAGPGTGEDDASIWTTYDGPGGLASYDAGSIAVDLDGAVWIGSEELGGVSRFDGETWTTYTEENGLAGDMVSGIAVAPDGTVWVAATGGISRFDGETWTTYTRADGPECYDVGSIAVDLDGAVWIGSRQLGGVSRFDPNAKGEAWRTYATAGCLAGPHVTAIAVAPDGTVWFGTWGYGISRFDPVAEGEAWTTYTTADGLADNVVRTIAVASDNTVWAGTWGYGPRDGGVSRFDGETWSTYTTSNSGLVNLRVQSLAIDDQDQVWMGTEGGLSVYDERAAVPARILQLWGFLRIGGLAALALLAARWWIRRPSVMVTDRGLSTRPGRAALTAGLKAGLVAGLVAAAPQLLQLAESLRGLACILGLFAPLAAVLGSGILAALWLPVPRQAEEPDARLAPSVRLGDTDSAALAGAVAGAVVATMHIIYVLLGLFAEWDFTFESGHGTPWAMVSLVTSVALGAGGGVVSAAVRKSRTSSPQRPKERPLPITGRPTMVVGRGLATVTGGGMAAVTGSTVIWFLLDRLISFRPFALDSSFTIPQDVWFADFTVLLEGTLGGLLAVNALLGVLVWRAAQKQDEGMRSGVLGKANCTIALIGSVGMTVVLGLGSVAALQVDFSSLTPPGLLPLSVSVGLFGAFVGVLVGVTVATMVRAVVSSGAGKLGQEEAGVLSSVDAVLSVLSIILFLTLICFWIASTRFTGSGLTYLGVACPVGGLIAMTMALLFRGLGGWTAPESYARGEQRGQTLVEPEEREVKEPQKGDNDG